ncbi:MAG: chromosomal replication initiator protein DnaA [Puniceicoccales bacterium]|nr:chromosomal replication initiator protein DnaA [Puniceicoccales bacterium]
MSGNIVDNLVDTAENSGSIMAIWDSFQEDFRQLFPEDIYHTWFENLKPIRELGDSLTLMAPNEFAAIWIRDNYKSTIERRIASRTGRIISIAFDFICEAKERENPSSAPTAMPALRKQRAKAVQKCDGNALINPAYTFDNFVIGSGNQLAQATCVAVANNPGQSYNPLFLYGATGLGKTHLLQAVAHEAWKKRSRLKIVYTSTEKFTNEFIKSVQENRVAKFRESYRKVDMLLIDDVHFLTGKERIQEEFFYTFNELFESQRQICLCSDRPASEIARLESRLVSRFQWGFIADIQAPDLETRIAILQQKASAMHLELPEEVIHLLAKSVSTNIRRLEGALNRIAGYTALKNRPIGSGEARELLQDIFMDETRCTIRIDQIQRHVAEYYHITLADLLGKKRPANIVFPRQVAMYLSRLLTAHSLQRIGSEFGGRDHATVIHACKSVECAIEQDPEAKRAVEAIQESLK